MNKATVTLEKPLLWNMYRALVGIGIVCAILLASVYLLTMPYIAANKAEALHQAIVSVLGNVHHIQALRWQDKQFMAMDISQASSKDKVYAGYDQQGQLLGLAIVANGMGYQDNIELIYGYAPKQQLIKGMSILENRETPGLGNRIASDKTFLRQFRQFDVHLNQSGSALAHDIRVGKKGQALKPGQIDSISGATISSKAVARILNNSAQHWLPILQVDLPRKISSNKDKLESRSSIK